MSTVRECRCGKPLTLVTSRGWRHADGGTYRHRIELADGPSAPTLAEDAEDLRRVAASLPHDHIAARAVLAAVAGRLVES